MNKAETANPLPVATFNRASVQTIREALAICEQRGNEYSDSWALENLKTPWIDNLFNNHPVGSVPNSLMPHYKRLVALGSMLDIKISRLSGPYKPDTSYDSINYTGAYNTLRLEFDAEMVKAKTAQAAA